MIEACFAQSLETGIRPSRRAARQELLLFPDCAKLINEYSTLGLGGVATYGLRRMAAD